MWIILSILVLAIMIPVLWILLARLVLCIDSVRSLYYLEMKGLVRLQVLPEGERLMIGVRVPFWTYVFDPMEELLKPKKKKEVKAPGRKEKKKGGRLSVKKGFREIIALVFQLLRSIFRSFQVERFAVQIDTGNDPMNAKLIPVFFWINRHTVMRYEVNFMDRNSVDLLIKNRLIRIVIPVAKTIFKLYR